MNKEDLIKYIDTINKSYLVSMNSAEERKDLCQKLLIEIKKYPDLKAPSCWEDCINNPGVYNELKIRRDSANV
jgi:hypothetical protein